MRRIGGKARGGFRLMIMAYDLPLAQITSFRIGGPADLFVNLLLPGN